MGLKFLSQVMVLGLKIIELWGPGGAKLHSFYGLINKVFRFSDHLKKKSKVSPQVKKRCQIPCIVLCYRVYCEVHMENAEGIKGRKNVRLESP